jgi:gluconokinase
MAYFSKNTGMAYIIGVDIGTSSTKVIAAGEDGKVMAHHQQDYKINQPRPGWGEQDPEEILQAVKSGIRSVATIMRYAPAAISFSSAMHSVMALDKNGKALTPLIIWADNRSQSIADNLKASENKREVSGNTPEASANTLFEQTGVPIHPMSPLCKIIWIKENYPEADKFIGVKEYVFHKFFGRYITDHSIASATGLFNIHTATWNEASLRTAGITADQLPEPVSSDTIITGLDASIASELGIPADTKFTAGASDGCLAQLGSNALDEGHATLTIGTSGAVRMAVDHPAVDKKARLFTYILTPGRFVTGGAINNGGVLLQWFLDAFVKNVSGQGMSIDAGLQQALAIPPGSEGLLCLPYLHGERAPIWDGHATGTFIGVRPLHNSWHFMRAMLEGMAYGLREITDALEETAGPVKKISISGGFTASALWVQLVADVLQRELHLQEEGDASAMGAVLLGFQALGQKVTFAAGEEKVFKPSTEHKDIYSEGYARHGKVYQALKGLF